jgi:hypothetical protein
MPTKGEVVSLDLEVVSVDLSEIPIDEILQFRDENRSAHRKYMQDLRKFAADLSSLEPVERQRALRDRHAELQEEAEALRTLSFKAWKSPAKAGALALGLTGTALSLAGAPIVAIAVGAAIASALGSLLGMAPDAQEASAYTYLFKAGRQFR